MPTGSSQRFSQQRCSRNKKYHLLIAYFSSAFKMFFCKRIINGGITWEFFRLLSFIIREELLWQIYLSYWIFWRDNLMLQKYYYKNSTFKFSRVVRYCFSTSFLFWRYINRKLHVNGTIFSKCSSFKPFQSNYNLMFSVCIRFLSPWDCWW